MLVKWYDVLKWLLERIDNFPKSQRFIFGQRLADHAVEVLELLAARGHGAGSGAGSGRNSKLHSPRADYWH